MKLISMTDYVLEQNSNKSSSLWCPPFVLQNVVNYANFLKQPLKLGMFIPCDENDVPLELNETTKLNAVFLNQYQQAKDRVLFEGFEIIGDYLFRKMNVCLFQISECNLYTTEHLLSFEEFDVTLTESAIKYHGL